jgi:hypothetical protein
MTAAIDEISEGAAERALWILPSGVVGATAGADIVGVGAAAGSSVVAASLWDSPQAASIRHKATVETGRLRMVLLTV